MAAIQPSRVEIRVIAGTLRGRKISCVVHEGLRPTPQMVREALFSILGNAVPGRPFFDIFAGTGIHGIEAISRGATEATFIEYDTKLVTAISKKMVEFGIQNQGLTMRADAYRWMERWVPPQGPVNLFFSPPFPDLTERYEAFLQMIAIAAQKAPLYSCVCIQAEDGFATDQLPGTNWDIRTYGRNVLAIWVKEPPAPEGEATPDATPESVN